MKKMMKRLLGLLLASLVAVTALAGTDWSPQQKVGRIYRLALGSGVAPTAADAAFNGVQTGDMVENTDDGCLYIMHTTNVYTKITAAGGVTVVTLAPTTLTVGGSATVGDTLTVKTNFGVGGTATITNDLTVLGGDVIGAKTNSIDIGEIADGTITLKRSNTGTMTLTSLDDDANAALTISAGGSGALTLGDSGSTSEIISSDWTISTAGVIANADMSATELTAGTIATAIDGSAITNLAAGNIASGTLGNSRLDTDLQALAINNGGSLTNVTGTASPNGTVLNALDISACTNLAPTGIAGVVAGWSGVITNSSTLGTNTIYVHNGIITNSVPTP